MADSARLTFTGFLSGNLSLPRRTFLELGGFDEEVGRLRREDWLFGLVALDSGLEVTYAPDAVAVHEFRLPVRTRLRAAHAEGRGDALLIAHRPELELLLDAPVTRGWRPAALAVRGWAQVAARPRAIAAACATLDLLERARMRRRWLRGFQVAQAASYTAGRRAGRGARLAHRRPREAAGRRRRVGRAAPRAARVRHAVRAAGGRTAARARRARITGPGTVRWPTARRAS